jgi:hypothetical protein
MCEVASIAYIAAAVIGAYSGIKAGNAAKASGEYQQKVADQNAALSDFKAEETGKLGAIQEERQRAKVRQVIGSQRASLAANGIDLSSGTALDLVGETAAFGEEDALMLRYNAMNEAWGYRTQATNFRNDGSAAASTGQNQASAAYLTTAGNLAGSYSDYRSANPTVKKKKGVTSNVTTINTGSGYRNYG